MFLVIEVVNGSVSQSLPFTDVDAAIEYAESVAQDNGYEQTAGKFEWFSNSEPDAFHVCVFDMAEQEIVEEAEED